MQCKCQLLAAWGHNEALESEFWNSVQLTTCWSSNRATRELWNENTMQKCAKIKSKPREKPTTATKQMGPVQLPCFWAPPIFTFAAPCGFF